MCIAQVLRRTNLTTGVLREELDNKELRGHGRRGHDRSNRADKNESRFGKGEAQYLVGDRGRLVVRACEHLRVWVRKDAEL